MGHIIPEPDRRKYPSDAEIAKIKASLGVKKEDCLPRCPAGSIAKRKKLQAAGEACDDCGKRGHTPCHKCRCPSTCGSGTEHYGVGFCFSHEKGRNRAIAEKYARTHKTALQQGFPLKPVRYVSDNDYLVQIQEEAVDAREKMETVRELDLVRAKLQEFEDKIYADDFKVLFKGELVPAGDDVKIDAVTKLTRAIGSLAKINLEVTDSDYIHKNEIKLWFQEILNVTRAAMTSDEEFEEWLDKFKQIPVPQSGRKT